MLVCFKSIELNVVQSATKIFGIKLNSPQQLHFTGFEGSFSRK